MIRRRIRLTITVSLLIAAIVILKEPAWESNLNIWLRCDEGVSGTLSVISLLPDCKGRLVEEGFDVKAACEKGALEYSHYRGWADVLFTLKRDNDEIARLVSKNGLDIWVDNHQGFVVMIKILNAPPFLTNDGI
ncbi:MAG: hypothetical protein LGR52_11185 [Candidatus Thiosymbion ectosymbiont of Robbea hypermnestra]|nr:hypothetical protein [Candidatus Thiosymbion ectosymbiont of Robbea hypermnestra]